MKTLEERLELLEKEVEELKFGISRLEMEVSRDRLKVTPYGPIQPLQVPSGCPVCGLKWDGPMGYVCTNPNCPTRITC